ncbi:MAG: tRNA (adenosine(37)-N6)-threonylcarbamoyltransferase complex transferase subunit TsaD [Kiritimatiellae bacterium]|nr:tRNA (adenosine(37)-N6)-threonylcarbamoyltransferase complex transferase subunit TsaD [Kiritimatiellia bacterium]
MNIIGIETSCDETAAAVVKDGREVLSNVVYTQIPLHQPYGGVVPEIASRAHIEKISQVIGSALDSFTPPLTHSPNRIDAVAVTYGPGLAPALIVGINAAKGLAKSLGVPLIAVNHIEAHLHSPFIYDSPDDAAARLSDPREIGPMLGLAVSGGNTVWIDMPEYGKYEVIGETLDDAAGEAFDKAAKLLGLGYPGGLKIDRISAAYRERFPNEPLVPFPKGRPRDGVTALAGLPAELCVSFSGLKTALLRHVQHNPSLVESKEGAQDFGGYDVTPEVAHVVASYQEAIVQAIADRTRAALRRGSYRAFVLGGGVSLNSRVRAVLTKVCSAAHVPLLMAKPKFTGDNGAMVAGLAFYRRNVFGDAAFRADVSPSLQVGLA